MINGWSVDPIKVSPIVMEASSSDDKAYMKSMGKEDIHQVNGTLIQGLYKTIIDRKNCDFGDIPNSKGDIRKVKYYESNSECLKILSELMEKNNIPKTEVEIVQEATNNIILYRTTFESAFTLKQDYLILFYNTIVMAVIDATSMLIADYMNYILGPEQSRYDSVKSKNDKGRGSISLSNLKRFNDEVRVGHFEKTADFLLNSQRKNFIGTGIVIAGGVVVALIAVVPITRELIYFYYKTRVRISDYLQIQADFLELNAMSVKSSNRPNSEKKDILRKQEKIILKMRRKADKLKINDEDIGALARKQVEDDNKGFSLKNIEKTMYSNKMDGVGLSIV